MAAPVLIEGQESGGISCEMYESKCRRFWRKDGRKLAYLTAGGALHLVDTAIGSRSQALAIAAPQGETVTGFSGPP